jgi:hypothetical protein
MDPTLTISIDRTGMVGAPAPLTFSATPGVGTLGITDYTEPAVAPQNIYASTSDYEHGETIRGARWHNTLLSWEVVTDAASTEQAAREAIAEVLAAVSRLEYEVTVTVDGAPAETWLAQGYGTVTVNGARTFANLRDHNPVWSITLPVYPTREIA